MSGAREVLFALLLAAELAAGGPREAAAPHRASAARAVRGGARSPPLVAGGLAGRPPGAAGSSRLVGGRWAGAVSYRRGFRPGRGAEGALGSRGAAPLALSPRLSRASREAARFRGGSQKSSWRRLRTACMKLGLGTSPYGFWWKTGRP